MNAETKAANSDSHARLAHPRWNSRGYLAAAWLGVAVLAVAVLVMAFLGRWQVALILALFLAGSLLLLGVEKRLPTLFDLLFVVAALLNAGGWAFDWFSVIAYYDDVTHAFTIFATTLSFGLLIFFSVRVHFVAHRSLFILVIASFGIAVGAVWEIVEWFFIGELKDIVPDLIADTLGAAAAGLLAAAALRQPAG